MANPETDSEVAANEAQLTPQEVDQQAAILIEEFKVVLRQSPKFLEQLADKFFYNIAGDIITGDRDEVKFPARDSGYLVKDRFMYNGRDQNWEEFTLIEQSKLDNKPERVADSHELHLTARKNMNSRRFTTPKISYLGPDQKSHLNTSIAIQKAREMLGRLSSQK